MIPPPSIVPPKKLSHDFRKPSGGSRRDLLVAKSDKLSHNLSLLVSGQSEREKVLAEVARYRNLSPDERWRAMRSACRAAAKVLATRPDAARVLAFVDPLPQRSKEILSRLREKNAK